MPLRCLLSHTAFACARPPAAPDYADPWWAAVDTEEGWDVVNPAQRRDFAWVCSFNTSFLSIRVEFERLGGATHPNPLRDSAE